MTGTEIHSVVASYPLSSTCTHFNHTYFNRINQGYIHVSSNVYTRPQWRRHGGGASGATCPSPQPPIGHPVRSMQIRGDFRVRKKMGVGLQDLPRSFTCTDATADVLWSYDYEKEGFVEVVERVTLVGPR